MTVAGLCLILLSAGVADTRHEEVGAEALQRLRGLDPEVYRRWRRPDPEVTRELRALDLPAAVLERHLVGLEALHPGLDARESEALRAGLLLALAAHGDEASFRVVGAEARSSVATLATRRVAMLALARQGRPEAASVLRDLAARTQPLEVRLGALVALGQLRRVEAVGVLARHVDDDEVAVRHAVSSALGHLASAWAAQAEGASGLALRAEALRWLEASTKPAR